MSNESMANQLTDVPSAIAELLALNKQLKQQLEEAVEVIERMKCNEDIDSEDCPKCSFLAKYRGGGEMIPDKYKNTCPLDHSTYEKYIECNCNFGSANEVWYFKEQELAKLKAENEKLKAELFNQKEHYEVLKENYDSVFIFMAEKTDRTISECFDRYKDWLVK